MKLVCDCGNEAEFDVIPDERDSVPYTILNQKTIRVHPFSFGRNSYLIECTKCGKEIWFVGLTWGMVEDRYEAGM